ncbi:MAG: hypothetical protein A2W91_15355 [Bacteroidetes bacterium GWF2_38_335]|nr:MAG: hypothetical protein A2W91_15355 [Bacteroidetes bacterium GWF2_38_335]OFY81045.1 MAG: hypothetical protein A2281_13125 [Bacteroidetes bacterium RIFOXYA12_FULL_38_20]HBS87639.1 hypothetical protein [Bacteroidales bacterium]
MSLKKTYLLIILALATVFTLIFIFTEYVEGEGFNPSDDGVVLAQSYRIINGEVPHTDFISIRPVFSGLLHTIHFYSPLPLQISARWFVILEFFLYSLIWVFFIMKLIPFNEIGRKKMYFAILLMICFVFNLSMYNLYPWTTIDAILFSSAGILLWLNGRQKHGLRWLSISAGLFLLAISALCRQNFVFLFAAFSVLTMIVFSREKKWGQMIATLGAGALPLVIYLIILAYNNGIGDFIIQMTGRTELLKTGVFTFAKRFAESVFLEWYIALAVLFGLSFIRKTTGEKIKLFLEITPYINISLALIISSVLFFRETDFLFLTSFELFWLFSCTYILHFFLVKGSTEYKNKGWIILMFGWVSSISLGDNAPAFVMGIMLISILVFNMSLVWHKPLIRRKFVIYVLGIFSMAMAVAEIYGQKSNNYRELPASQLQYNLGEIYPGFGGIITNQNTYNYYKELKEIIDSNPGMKDRFVVIPNNPLIYAVSGSRNPMPLDWMQQAEYVGSEKRIVEELKMLIQETDTVWFIIDKYDSKKMCDSLFEMDYSTGNHDYYDLLTKLTKESEKKYHNFVIRF